VYSIETFPQRQLPDAMIDLLMYVINMWYAIVVVVLSLFVVCSSKVQFFVVVGAAVS
jgi:hypothetical protein